MDNTSAGISVIVPTRNRPRFLRRALDSVLAQRVPAEEVIVVDDASSDATETVVRSYRDASICYLKLSERRGAAHARNMGIQAAKGPYLALLDDDDV